MLKLNDQLITCNYKMILSKILTGVVIAAHLYTLYIEMFAWETKGREAFKGILPPEVFTPVKSLAANLGLYNGFLAAGLGWTFFISDPAWKTNVSLFFLCCVIVAGIYGALTGSKKIFFYQAFPAILALISVIVFG